MGYSVTKTEHGGSKKGRGSYYGHKAIAKHESSRVRRRRAKIEAAKARLCVETLSHPAITRICGGGANG